MSFISRHGDHEHEHGDKEESGHSHGNEDSIRQQALASLYWYVVAAVLVTGFIARLIVAFIARQR